MIVPPPKEAPRSPFALEVLARLPLADPFDARRGHRYEDRLSFAEPVAVLTDALTRYQGGGNRAIAMALGHNQLSVKARAPYGKQARLPLPLAEASLAGLTARSQPLF